MTGMTQEEYAQMMLTGGRSPEGNRYRRRGGQAAMARITAGVTTSHVPAIGAALDLGKTQEPYWQPLFEGYEVLEALDRSQPAGRRHPGLQRPRHGV